MNSSSSFSLVIILVVICSVLSVSISVAAFAQAEDGFPFRAGRIGNHYNRFGGPPRVGYYARTCPNAEKIVRQTVYEAVSLNHGIAAGLIRLHFHDCFVRGCDASVLLDTLPKRPTAEKDTPPNKGLRGLEVIDAAKAQLETICPGIVSCADILTFAARDSASKVGNINYNVKSGRRDGRVSRASDVFDNLPPPFFNASGVIASFANKGLSIDEMVTLSGAHSIGISHCSSFADRLYPTPDPSMDPSFAAYLITICPNPLSANGVGPDPTVSQDFITPHTLDNKYYAALMNRRGLFTSDQTLYSNTLTSPFVSYYAKNPADWGKKFAAAMVRMGSLDVLQYPRGEIRKNCHLVN